MAFPETRHTLIQRLASGGESADWREFLDDYWGPVCRFAQRSGKISVADAEDVAAQTLEAIIRNRLLGRWSANRSAKLRTLICTVVRNVISNRARVNSGRERVAREHAGQLDRYLAADAASIAEEPPADQLDAFYAAWADGVVQLAVESLLADYLQSNQGDYFRVLYGKICDGLTMAEIAESLQMNPKSADTYYRRARDRLGEKLSSTLREHVSRYCAPQAAESELAEEWSRLGDYLQSHGGLEKAMRESYSAFPPEQRKSWENKVNLASLSGN